jgi:hypothetical protein
MVIKLLLYPILGLAGSGSGQTRGQDLGRNLLERARRDFPVRPDCGEQAGHFIGCDRLADEEALDELALHKT